MPSGLITEYHNDQQVGIILIDGQAESTFIAFQKSDCTGRLQAKLTGDIPPNPRLHVQFDPGVDSGSGDSGGPMPIAVNVDLSGVAVVAFGSGNRIEALMAVSAQFAKVPGKSAGTPIKKPSGGSKNKSD